MYTYAYRFSFSDEQSPNFRHFCKYFIVKSNKMKVRSWGRAINRASITDNWLYFAVLTTVEDQHQTRVWSRGRSLLEETPTPVYVLLDCTLNLVLLGFVAVCLTFAQFNSRLQFCLCSIVHKGETMFLKLGVKFLGL